MCCQKFKRGKAQKKKTAILSGSFRNFLLCAMLIPIGRRPERARVLRIKGAQSRLNAVAEAGDALFNGWTQ
jgi:hypothetical protein